MNECGDEPITNITGLEDTGYAGHNCDVNAMCANTYGNYNCTCDAGWQGDGFNCTDIDECEDEVLRATLDCDQFAECGNFPGMNKYYD